MCILNITHILSNQYSWLLLSGEANKTILNFLLSLCRKVSNILPMQSLQNIFWFDKYLHIFLSFVRSDMVLRSALNFSFVTSIPLRALFPVDTETKHSKRILSYLSLFYLMNGTVKIQFIALREFRNFSILFAWENVYKNWLFFSFVDVRPKV